jgi:TRAP-type C4-dicarboxylate transport system substrate-binding protein
MEAVMWERGPKWDKDMEAISNKNGIETVPPSKQMIADLEKITQKIRADWVKDAPPEGKKIYADFLKKVGR